MSPSANCCNCITDLNNEDFNKVQTPRESVLQPRVVFISERFAFGSVLSHKAMETIQDLVHLDNHLCLKEDKLGDSVLYLVKAALRLSYASSVAMVT